jgi:hypothetical protein
VQFCPYGQQLVFNVSVAVAAVWSCIPLACLLCSQESCRQQQGSLAGKVLDILSDSGPCIEAGPGIPFLCSMSSVTTQQAVFAVC